MKYQKILKEYFDEHTDEILDDLREIVSIKSVADENSSVKPFGKGSKEALEWGCNFMKKIGMDVKEFDGYAVRGDFNSNGDPQLAILAHLDTVPASDNWNYPPFDLTVKDDILYGRGTIDDKGPAVAVLWSAKAIKELNIPVNNFRIIFGGNEEGGCEDIEYYQKQENFPENVFTPDGSFPVLNCEKGMVHLTFSANFYDDEICEIKGGKVINAIPDSCEVNYLDNSKNTIKGKASHGSRPENGDNAVTKFLDNYNGRNKLLLELKKLFPYGEYNGISCGMGFSDNISGKMTCALTMLNVKNSVLTGGIDIRFPIDRTYKEISSIIINALENGGFVIDNCDGMEPHYVDENSEFVQTLLKVYENVKGEKGYCIAEGGITYVHNTPGAVAFGAEFPDENNNMHGDDEHITLETFKYNLNMYANAICELQGK